MKRFRPDYYCKSIFDIPISFYKKLNIKYIFSDLDNTLDQYDILIPSKRVMELKTKLLEIFTLPIFIDLLLALQIYLRIYFLHSLFLPFGQVFLPLY